MNDKPIILIVDDVGINRTILGSLFLGKYDILEAASGDEALGVLRSRGDISLVLLDVVMPGKTGFDVLREMKAEPGLARVPVVVTTAAGDEANEVKSLELGADDFVTKPYNPQLVRMRVLNVLSKAFILEKNLAKDLEESNRLLRYNARHDSITGLFNRQTFFFEAAKLLESRGECEYDIVCLNIERFKVLIDLFGKDGSDAVLKTVAEVFIREFGDFGTYGCLGDDRFVYCIPREKSDPEGFLEILNNDLTKLGHDYQITVDLGVYRIDDYSIPLVQMCDRANMALDGINGQYLECCAYYDSAMLKKLIDEQEIIGDMNDALTRGQFYINVQPIFSASKERPVSGEVLVRWRHPDKGIVSPGAFIPVFEKNGFITKLDYFVWEEACKLLRSQLDSKEPVIPLSVNVSRINFYNPNLCTVLKALVKKYSLDPKWLRLEITESAYTSNQQQLAKTIEELKREGFVFLMDDFGSGYSSLNMLNDLPVDILKIDMRFVRELEKSEKAGSVLSSIVRLAKWLELTPIAEGVETKEQLSYLKSIGCDYIQGYYFSKPLDTDSFRTLVKDYEADAPGSFGISRKLESLPDENALIRVTNEMFAMLGDLTGAFGIYEMHENVIEAVRVNDAYYSLTGSSPELMTRNELNALSWIYEDDRDRMREMFKRSVTSGRVEVEAIRRYHQDGDLLWLNMHVRHIGSTDERLLFYVSMIDYTDLKIAEEDEQLRSFVSAFSSVFESIYYLDITIGTVERLSEGGILEDEPGDGSAEEFISAILPQIALEDRARFSNAFSYSSVRKRLLADNLDTVSCAGITVITPSGGKSCFFSLVMLDENTYGHKTALFCMRRMGSELPPSVRTATGELLNTAQGDKKQVLIVDDNELNRKMLGKLLSDEYDVAEAADGKQALAYLSKSRGQVSAVLLDLLMPVMDGFTFLDRRGLDKSLAAIPVIVLSQADDSKSELEAFKRGANEYLKKPYEPVIIKRRLENLIKLHDTTADRNTVADIINRIPGGIGVFNVAGAIFGITYLSKSLQAVLGYTTEEFAEIGIEKIIHEDDLPGFIAAVRTSAKSMKPFEMDFRIIKPNDSTVWLNISSNPVATRGEGVFMYASMFDITRRKLGEATAERQALQIAKKSEVYENTIARVPCGVIMADVRGETPNIVFANTAAYSMCECSDLAEFRTAYHGSCVRLIHPDDREMVSKLLSDAKNGILGEEKVRIRLLARNGNVVFTEGVMINSENSQGIPVVQYAFVNVTEHTRSEVTLQNARQKLSSLNAKFVLAMSVSELSMLEYDPVSDTLEFAGAIVDMMGGRTKLRNLNKTIRESRYLSAECRSDVADMINSMREGVSAASCTARFVNDSGEERWYSVEMRSVTIGSDGCRSIIGSAQNITNVIRANQNFEAEMRYRLSLTNDSLAYAEYDFVTDRFLSGNLGELIDNPNMAKLSIVELRKSFFEKVIHPDDVYMFNSSNSFEKLMSEISNGKSETYLECRMKSPTGIFEGYKWVSVTMSYPVNPVTHHPHMLIIVKDIDARKSLELSAMDSAKRDPLTGLFNRSAFEKLTKNALRHAEKDASLCAFVMLDIDDFKDINDTFGHKYGDAVLQHIGDCLKRVFRSSDIIARHGGDEFVVLMTNLPSAAIAYSRCAELCRSLGLLREDGSEMMINCSVGIAMYPEHGAEFGQLYQNADLALYQAKQSGKNRCCMYNSVSTVPAMGDWVDKEWLVDAIDGMLYIVDNDTDEVLYMNGSARKRFGDDYKGKKCYEVMMRRSTPCEKCTVKCAGDEARCHSLHNDYLGKELLIQNRAIKWNGHNARIELAIAVEKPE